MSVSLPTLDASQPRRSEPQPLDGASVNVYPLLDCNARCPFCSTRVYTDSGIAFPADHQAGIADRRAKDYRQPLDDLKAQYDRFRKEGVQRVSIQGGEPTMYEGLLDIIAYGQALGLPLQTVVSNGRRFADRAFAQAFLEGAPEVLVLSIFGARATTHDASMGVPRAFEDMTEGVRNLISLRAQGLGAKLAISAQFTLHAGNFRELPQMVRHWYGEGLRHFTIRLLKSTHNTDKEPERWFFDLAKLREPLAEALDIVGAHSDASVSFSELPRCLPPRSHLGAVLRDLGSNPNLRMPKRAVARHFEGMIQGRGGARARKKNDDSACAGCDLREGCLRVGEPQLTYFTGTLEPWHVAENVAAFVAGPLDKTQLPRIAQLLAQEEVAGRFGVSRDTMRALRATYVRAVAELEPERFSDVVLGERGRSELENRLRKSGHRPVSVRAVPVGGLAGGGPWGPDWRANLKRLTAGLDEADARPFRFLEGIVCVVNEPLLMVFAHARRGPEGESLALTVLYDETLLPPALLDASLAPIVPVGSSAP